MDRVSINSARNYSRNANLSFFRSNRNRASNIPVDRKSFLQFFSRFQHFSNSISLSLFELSFTNPVRDRYIPARLTFRSFGQLRRSKNILFNRERNFDTCSNSPPPIVSVLQAGGSFGVIFQRDVRPPRYSTLLGSFDVRKLDEETKRRAAAYGRIDGRTWMVLSVRKRVAGA